MKIRTKAGVAGIALVLGAWGSAAADTSPPGRKISVFVTQTYSRARMAVDFPELPGTDSTGKEEVMVDSGVNNSDFRELAEMVKNKKIKDKNELKSLLEKRGELTAHIIQAVGTCISSKPLDKSLPEGKAECGTEDSARLSELLAKMEQQDRAARHPSLKLKRPGEFSYIAPDMNLESSNDPGNPVLWHSSLQKLGIWGFRCDKSTPAKCEVIPSPVVTATYRWKVRNEEFQKEMERVAAPPYPWGIPSSVDEDTQVKADAPPEPDPGVPSIQAADSAPALAPEKPTIRTID